MSLSKKYYKYYIYNMDYSWKGSKKRLFNSIEEDGNKTENKKKKIWDGLSDTTLINSVKNHIYFYSGVCKKSCMNLNIEIKKVANDLMTNKNNFSKLDMYIYIHINSFGGSIFAALSTIDTIINCPIPIVTIIEGAAASAATLISVVADYRIMTENSYMLIHQLSSSTWGKMDDLEEEMENLKTLMNKIKGIYSDYTDLKQHELDEILKHDIWWDTKKCLSVGLIDKIIKKKKFYQIEKDKIEYNC